MASENSFVQPAIPRFDGHYDHWSMLMENFLRSKEYWNLIETGITAAAEGSSLSEIQQKTYDDQKLKDLKAKNYLFQAIDRSILETILKKDTAKEIWDSLKQKYQGTARVKRAQLQALRKEFEVLHMKNAESVNDYFGRTLTIANKMCIHGEQMDDVVIIEKILRSMTSKYDYVVCSIEESNDLDTMSIDELQSNLLVHEQRISRHVNDEQALQITHGFQQGGRGGGRGTYQGRGRGRGRFGFNKSIIECYYCHALGHFQWNVLNEIRKQRVNYAETKDEMLLMAFIDSNESDMEHIWFLDSGCTFEKTVKLGNDSSLTVQGKGNIRMEVNGCVHVITEVFYVPDLKNNLLSIGQLQEKGLTVLIQRGICKNISQRERFVRIAWWEDNIVIHFLEQACGEPTTFYSWYMLTYVDQLIQFQMAIKRYLITFIDDYSRKTWVFFLMAKSEAYSTFKSFKARVEKETGSYIRSLRTDRGGEFTSQDFTDFCNEHGIQRQLTTAYSPQQNGVAERKNRTIMNIVRSILTAKQIPKTFWPEAVNWTVHILNRCPTLAVKNKTPAEMWNGHKPSVDYFRVFGCISHVHVPDSKRIKLDARSVKCILLGVSDESKAYKLFDPISNKIIISRDVVFEEDKQWTWDDDHKQAIYTELEWDNDTEGAVEIEGAVENAGGDSEESIFREETGDSEPSEPDGGNIEIDGGNIEADGDNINISHEEQASSPATRTRRPPVWISDYETGQGLSDEETVNLTQLALFTDGDSYYIC
nr:uncharacterized protein LOC118033088 [Populus alba]